jgi:hypothetical protein
MHLIRRKFVIALLLTLVLSHAAVSVHAATHLSTDAVDCDLCSGFSNSPGVIPDYEMAQLPDYTAPFDSDHSAVSIPTQAVAAAYPRGPPILS